MYKHLYKPYGYSFFNGVDTVCSYRCVCCGKVISSYYNISKMSKSDTLCKGNMSASTTAEYLMGEYDCSIHNPSFIYKYTTIKQKIKKVIKRLENKGWYLWLYIMSLRIK